jgi:ribulose bisphosphate carboxylase small subunit
MNELQRFRISHPGEVVAGVDPKDVKLRICSFCIDLPMKYS